MEVRKQYNYDTYEYTWPFGAHEDVADVDESESYEVDQTQIVYVPSTDKFWLLTASGCSCWDGDWDAEEFDNLDVLFASLIDGRADERQYTPSFKGAQTLREQASKWVGGRS